MAVGVFGGGLGTGRVGVTGAVSVEIFGAKELQKELDRLPYKLHRKIERRGIKAGAQVIANAAKANASEHVKTGLMRKSITVRAGKRHRTIIRQNVVFKNVKQLSGAQIIRSAKEKGKRRKVIGTIESTKPYFYPAAVEYGSRGRMGSRFIRRAFESTKDIAVGKVRAVILRELEAVRKETLAKVSK